MAIFNTVYGGTGGGWKPGANTLAYLPLATNSNDQSGNGNNGTNTNITFSNSKAVFSNGTSCILFDTTSIPNTFTLNVIAQMTDNTGYQVLYRHSNGSGNDQSRCYLRGYGNVQLGMADGNTVVTGITADTNEHLYSFVVSSTNMKFYIDGDLKYTYTKNVGNVSGAKLSLGNRWYNMNEGLKGTMREVILESSLRTDAEVLSLAKQFGFAS